MLASCVDLTRGRSFLPAYLLLAGAFSPSPSGYCMLF